MSGDRLSMAQAAREMGVHIGTVHRWWLRGIRGIHLRTKLFGGRRYVFRSDLDEFSAAINGELSEAEPVDDRAHERAEAELDREIPRKGRAKRVREPVATK